MTATTQSDSVVPIIAHGRAPARVAVAQVGLFLLLVLAVAWWVPNQFGAKWVSTWTTTLVFAMAAAGIGFLYSRLGLASLAQVALVGVGGWVALRLEFGTGLPFFVIVLLSATITAGIGALLSLPALRLRGLYLTVMTLMMAAGFDEIFNATGFPNGGSGFLGYQASGELQRMNRPSIAESDAAYFRLVLVVAVVMFAFVWLHERTKPGRAWHLIAQSEGAAYSSGIDVVMYKTWAFVLAAFLSGVAGAMFAGQLGQLGPSSFETIDSLILFALVLVGGAYHWTGWLIGAVLFKAFPAFLDDRGLSGDIATMIAGAAAIVNLIAAPRGIVGEVMKASAGLRGRRRRGARDDTGVEE